MWCYQSPAQLKAASGTQWSISLEMDHPINIFAS
jgi:hypothetical protein